ncbi:hypothetical protein G9A89_005075 [Geosiphon pyriformis]|nr:hypothetical protein G9A89_005075 [Geosiphon pyriformis]
MAENNLAELEFSSSIDFQPLLRNKKKSVNTNEAITTQLELFSWKFYAFGSEVYAVIGLSFMALILERLAANQGVLSSDHLTPCINSTALEASEEIRCVVKIFGKHVDTAAFSMYTFSISVFLQAITAISIGAAADHGSVRKALLLFFAFFGSISTMCFLIPTLLLAFVAISSNVSFGASIVCLNGFLPVLVRNHPETREIANRIRAYTNRDSQNPENDYDRIHVVESEEIPNENTSIDHLTTTKDRSVFSSSDESLCDEPISHNKTIEDLILDLNTKKEQLTGQISLEGFSYGYFGGVILLSVCLVISIILHGSIMSLQIGVFLSGLWWFLVSLFLSRLLPNRPGPPLKLGNGDKVRPIDYVTFSWKRLWINILEAKHLKMTFRFLTAWFLLSDGYTTISSVALLFAQTTLQISPTGLITISLLTPVSALLGTILWPKIQTYLELTTKQTILLLLLFLVTIPLYGCLGFISPIGGLKTSAEMYFLAILYGFLIGPIQGYCRSLFAELIPQGRETEFFALYAVTDKGSSWLGPLLVAIITDLTHEIRYGFLLLVVLLFLPIPILWNLDVKQGRIQATEASIEEDNFRN